MPQEFTTNIMHQIPDIENNNYELLKNNYELLKNKLNVHDKRIVKLEDKLEDKFGCISSCCNFLETVCLWTLVILLSIKVFS